MHIRESERGREIEPYLNDDILPNLINSTVPRREKKSLFRVRLQREARTMKPTHRTNFHFSTVCMCVLARVIRLRFVDGLFFHFVDDSCSDHGWIYNDNVESSVCLPFVGLFCQCDVGTVSFQ